ncbi:MAG: hypothetical protein KGN84_19415 [Acidobacteriota bacterium]|nr:hypothetical protein [Acidobacteriota bacterium]
MTFHVRPFTTLCAAAMLLGGAALHATTANTEKFQVDFAFHVQHGKKVLPAGEYQVERVGGLPFVVLRNTKTGETVNVMSTDNTHEKGKTKLVFQDDASGHSLEKIL